MKIARLDRRIEIQAPGSEVDDYGHQSSGWQTFVSVRANIKPMSAREKVNVLMPESTLTHTVMVRYRPDLMPELRADGWRILYGNRVLSIDSAIDVDDARRWIVFNCTESEAI